MKAYGDVEVQLHSFLTSTLHEGDQCPYRFATEEGALHSHWKEAGWDQNRSGCLGKENFLPLPRIEEL